MAERGRVNARDPEQTVRGRLAGHMISGISRWVGGKRFDDWLKALIIEGAWAQQHPPVLPPAPKPNPEWLAGAHAFTH